ncbi:uncharacterized protein VTP21DRAFT_9386 [Calcarisporiella thermophila]|uniref:uncharacterized protein n=1 Tax=Calcarisporiella thermophila TaxID=911321 RepID=UPI003742A51E
MSLFQCIATNNVELARTLLRNVRWSNHPQEGSPRLSAGSGSYQRHSLQGSSGKYLCDPNKRSTLGRTPLHLAASKNRVEIAKLLVECPAVNINLQDLENGWTALHRALYSGNLEIALILMSRKSIDLHIKDYDGNTAFDLLNSTVEGTAPPLTITEGDELFTWGLNANYVLGHPDSDNRTFPEHVHFFNTTIHADLARMSIREIAMAKMHTAVVTSEPMDNLYLCGFGRGGRLGLRAETQLTLKRVAGLNAQVKTVALGRDHTVVVTAKGDVYTFGSNRHGQLGYVVDVAENEEPLQQSPRKVIATLKKEIILGAAASRVHTVVHTETDMYSFGLHQGQLGYPKNTHSDIQPVPRNMFVAPSGQKILQVAATEKATACLLSTHDVLVFADYSSHRVIFPMERFPPEISVYRHEPNYIVRILSGGDQFLGAVSSTGDFYTWSTNGFGASSGDHPLPRRNQRRHAVSDPKRVWSLRKKHFAVRDAAIGQDGAVLIATESGHVFYGVPRKEVKRDKSGVGKKFHKFSRVQYLQRVVMVRASPQGAFAAVKSNVLREALSVRNTAMDEDLRKVLTHLSLEESANKGREEMKEEGADDADGENEETTSGGSDSENLPADSLTKNNTEKKATRHGSGARSSAHTVAMPLANIHKLWDSQPPLPSKGGDFAFLVEGRRVWAHRAILAARSRVFLEVFRETDPARQRELAAELGSVRWCDEGLGGRRYLELQLGGGFLMQSILLLLEYLYTDRFIPIWQPSLYNSQPHSLKLSEEDARIAQTVLADLKRLARILELPLLRNALHSFSCRPAPSLTTDLAKFCPLVIRSAGEGTWEAETAGSNGEYLADTYIRLADGVVQCHEIILKRRCRFFDALLDTEWVRHRLDEARRQYPVLLGAKVSSGHACGDRSGVVVDLAHLRWEVFQYALRNLYGAEGSEALQEVRCETLDGFIELLFEILAVANELLLSELKEACEAVIFRFLHLRNAVAILEIASTYEASQLKQACLKYLCTNLETVLESRLIDGLAPELLADLEAELREQQLNKMPVSRGGKLIPPVPEDMPSEVEDVWDGTGTKWYDARRESAVLSSSLEAKQEIAVGSYRSIATSSSIADEDGIELPSALDHEEPGDTEGASDMIFRMDSDSPARHPASPAYSQRRDEEEFTVVMRRRRSSASPLAKSPGLRSHPQPMADLMSPAASSSIGDGSPRNGSNVNGNWTRTEATESPKVDFRKIMEEQGSGHSAPSTRHSNAVSNLSPSKPDNFAGKVQQNAPTSPSAAVPTSPASTYLTPGAGSSQWPTLMSSTVTTPPRQASSKPSQPPMSVSKPSHSTSEEAAPYAFKHKLSQKERRRLAKEESRMEPNGQRKPAWVGWNVPKPESNSAGAAAGGNAPAKSSFLGIQMQQLKTEKRVSAKIHPSDAKSGWSSHNPWANDSGVDKFSGRETAGRSASIDASHSALEARPTYFVAHRRIRRPSQPSTSNALAVASSPPSSFASIQNQQLLEQQLARRTRKKNLTRIQYEERALEEMKIHYALLAEMGSGEWYTWTMIEEE